MGSIFSVGSRSCDQLVQPFLPFLCGKWKYLYNLEDNLEALQKEMQDLNAKRNELLKRVSKEEDRGLQGLQEVKAWISRVEEIEPKANRLLDESVSEIRRLSMYGYCSQIPASTYCYNEKVIMTLKEVETLRCKGVFEDVVDRALPSLVIKRPSIQLTVSQEKLLETAWDLLMDEEVGTLCIYGRGGVGKTTLLTRIEKKFVEDVNAFGPVIFAVVSSEEVKKSIEDEIIQRLRLQRGRKKFVLLLDGIQRVVDLVKIRVLLLSRQNECKIVFTTRSREVYESKWVDADIEVECLSPEESWDLFQKTVSLNTLRSHADIPKLARVVASTCRGLPLTLDLIGETMARKRTVHEWRYTIHALASSAVKFPDMEDEFLPILKSIYDNLSGKTIRLCFLYCALFPKNCDIRKEYLVSYWIGEGIIAKDDREIAETQGCEMIGDLVRMRLLLEDESGFFVKMHEVVHQMAVWIASDSWRGEENFERIHQMPMVNDWTVVRRMSVRSTQFENISGCRVFPHMAEEQKMDGSESESHLIQDIDLVGTTESRESATEKSSTEKKVFQSGTHATGVNVEQKQTDSLISNTIDNMKKKKK